MRCAHFQTYGRNAIRTFASFTVSVSLAHFLYVCPSVYLSFYLSVCPSLCLSICMSFYLSMCLSFYLSVCMSVYLSFFPFYPSIVSCPPNVQIRRQYVGQLVCERVCRLICCRWRRRNLLPQI